MPKNIENLENFKLIFYVDTAPLIVNSADIFGCFETIEQKHDT